MFTFLLILQTIVSIALVTVILLQRSEGGGLVASSSGSLMTARGAADFLTRATSILGAMFVILSIILAAIATYQRAPTTIDPSIARQAPAPSAPLDPGAGFGTPTTPVNDPLAAAAGQAAGQVPAGTAPAPATGNTPAAPAQPAPKTK